MPNKLRKYGITDEVYKAQRLSGNKWCSGCRQFLIPDRFTAQARGACTECQKLKAKQWHDSNRERTIFAMRANYQANRDKYRKLANQAYHSLSPEAKILRARRNSLTTKYGITEGWYVKQLAKQNGVCAICGKHSPMGKYGKYMAVDHDHSTGKPRGVLCHKCNTGIGWLDKSEWVPKALQYLQQYS